MQGFVEWLESLGVPMAPVQARMAMLSEISGGSALALGLFTRPACLLLIFTMIVAGRIGHRGAGYLITNEPPGAEYTINLAVICAVFLLLGPGRALARLICCSEAPAGSASFNARSAAARTLATAIAGGSSLERGHALRAVGAARDRRGLRSA